MHNPIIQLEIIIAIAIIIADFLSIISPLINFAIYINIFIMYFPFFQNLKTIFNYYTIALIFILIHPTHWTMLPIRSHRLPFLSIALAADPKWIVGR